MYIHSYQIHNVLNVYRKQISQVKTAQDQQASSKSQIDDRVSLSTKGKRQSIINKVAENVFEKITTIIPEADFGSELAKQVNNNLVSSGENGKKKEAGFLFNTIDQNNNKTTNSISVENSNSLMDRLEYLAKQAGKKSMNDE